VAGTHEALRPGAHFELLNDHDPKPLYYQFAAELPGQFTVSGFLGTLIGLERAVALRIAWTFLAPALSGLGGLSRYDVARRTVRTPGLPRFAAVGLLAGYAWLSLAGVLWITSPGLPAGLRYDAEMHALFLGFVFSVVFAHAPIIWPSVLGGEIQFRPRFYGHLALLHLSVLLRVASDLAAWEAGRRSNTKGEHGAVLMPEAPAYSSKTGPSSRTNPGSSGSRATRSGSSRRSGSWPGRFTSTVRV
jgi:hypothetical protein